MALIDEILEKETPDFLKNNNLNNEYTGNPNSVSSVFVILFFIALSGTLKFFIDKNFLSLLSTIPFLFFVLIFILTFLEVKFDKNK